MKLGISSYTYVWSVGVPGWPSPHPMNASDLLDKAVELEVKVLQIADNLPLEHVSEQEIDALARRAGQLGIEIEAGTRGIRTQHLRAHIRIASHLGSRLLRTLIGSPGHQPGEIEIIELLRGIAPDLERAGMTLSIENHDRLKASALRRVIECAGSERIGVCLDTANSLGCGEGLNQVLECLAPLVVNLHVKDFVARRLSHNKGFIIEGRPAGEGLVDVPGVIDVLRQSGRDPNVIVELWPPPEPDVSATIVKEEAWARRSVQYLRGLVSQ